MIAANGGSDSTIGSARRSQIVKISSREVVLFYTLNSVSVIRWEDISNCTTSIVLPNTASWRGVLSFIPQ